MHENEVKGNMLRSIYAQLQKAEPTPENRKKLAAVSAQFTRHIAEEEAESVRDPQSN